MGMHTRKQIAEYLASGIAGGLLANPNVNPMKIGADVIAEKTSELTYAILDKIRAADKKEKRPEKEDPEKENQDEQETESEDEFEPLE